LVTEIAREVAGVKGRARETIVKKVEQLSDLPASTSETIPHMERATQALVKQYEAVVKPDSQAL
jgi:hypothetical protein